ncbi:MAG: single-stranded DNA-binding protein [Puniceicoccaceae bacterium MED-G31]|nr:MAG: single-stranded DNA-binding protein [Puniceicoccaceae bacterium MED-G31]
MRLNKQSSALVEAARKLTDAVAELNFSEPTSVVYNPLEYASFPHEHYLRKYGDSSKKILFMGMNPGPFGMAQTGIPFGEVAHVRDWLGICGEVLAPKNEHPKRRIEGFNCARSEVSGRRFWGAMKERFGQAEAFFIDHFVINYCPLVFMEQSGRNRTPDKLPNKEVAALQACCDTHLRSVIHSLQPEWLIGVGAFAEARARVALSEDNVQFGRILHPSPASPAANRGWSAKMTEQMEALGLW